MKFEKNKNDSDDFKNNNEDLNNELKSEQHDHNLRLSDDEIEELKVNDSNNIEKIRFQINTQKNKTWSE